MPNSVIYFGIAAFVLIAFGLHALHIKSIGFDAFVKEIMKSHDFEYEDAKREAIMSMWFSLIMVLLSGLVAVAQLAISIKNLFNLNV